MLPKRIVKSSWCPTVKMTSFAGIRLLAAAAPGQSSRQQDGQPLNSNQRPVPQPMPTLAPVQLCPVRLAPTLSPINPADKVMPTPLIDEERQETKDCGTGAPAQRGRRKPLVWKRRHPWFDRQWTLDMKRQTKGPETPYFPEGVPFQPIRKLQSFAGRSFKINAGRRRKIRLSLKRGRRKLL